jgi:hypothetical protein
MKKSLVLAVSALSLVGALAGCGETKTTSVATTSAAPVVKTAEIAGVLDTNCVEDVKLTAENGKVKSITFGETPYFLCQAATVSDTDAAVLGTGNYLDATVTGYGGKTSTVHYAKYLKLDSVVLTGTLYDAKTNGEYVKYSTSGIADYFTYVNTSSDNALAYFNAVNAGKLSIVVDAKGTAPASEVKTGTVNSYVTYNKADTDNKYWPAGVNGLGWKANIAKIEAAMVGLDLSTAPTVVAPVAANSKTSTAAVAGKVNGVDTGATITSFASYFDIAVKAWALLK